MSAMPSSILDIFIVTANDPRTSGRRVIECGSDAWTYAELDVVSNAMAYELEATLCPRPKVAFVGENHPYIFALMLAVWKIGGIFVPIDAHVPPSLLDGMLDIVKPACLYLSAVDVSNVSRASELPVEVRVFHPESSTIPALNKRYGSGVTPLDTNINPNSDEPCLYLFTSSASSKENLKAVPLTPKFILSNCKSKLAWWREIQRTANLDGTRVLGWAPWSHVLSHMQDIGTATILTAGCYVFASVPSSYKAQQSPTDLTTRIIDGLLDKNVTALAALPFVVSGMKDACEAGSTSLLDALRGMTMLECGGAALDPAVAEWAESNGVPLIVGIGMTETGGAIFAGRAKESIVGFEKGTLIADAELSLDAAEGENEGELVVKSKFLPHGYIGYSDGSFSVDSEGWVTFKTRDRYRVQNSKFLWLGRATDYIQMTSGESLDPRPLEKSMRSSPLISDVCIIGDTFLRSASTAVCAIIELSDEGKLLDAVSAKKEVVRALAPINADLPPALRISMASVLILDGKQKIPRTKKGEVFRKKIEEVFGEALKGGAAPVENAGVDDQALENELTTIIGNVLGVSDTDMLNSMTFAELGMTSVLAVKLTATLNEHLAGRVVLPANVCYIHMDAPSLVAGVRNSLSPTASLSISNQQIVSSASTQEEIVIVGKSFRLPGGVNDDASLWATLMGKNDSVIAEIPSDRWDHASFYPSDICLNKAGLIEVASYDHGFFGMSATEAYYVSPTMRVALEVAFEALEDANIPVSKVKGTGMGVFVATKDDGFETLLNAAHGFDAYTRFYGTGRAPSTASGRISYLLDIHGPSVTVDTACSGGIVCIDQAIAHLQSGAGESAIVCSSNTHCWPGSFMFLTAQNMASPNSRCASFTSEADGYVPSEGAVAFILKTRSAAERDGNRILATVKATEVSHNGRSQGLAAPNVKAQAALHRAVLHKANMDPRELNFIETHGTGTTLGDLCEVQGINESFVSAHPRSGDPLIVSASKSALGHTEPSAGLVGMLSVLMAFKHGVVPGLLHLREDNVNKQLDLTQIPLLISPSPVVIDAPRPHRAAVLSYGFSGTLADIVLEGPAESSTSSSHNAGSPSPVLFVVSAKTSAALFAYIDAYLAFLRTADDGMFHSICYTSCVGREHYKHRFACVATDLSDLIRQLQDRASATNATKVSAGSLAFAFPGQGTHFPGMAAALAKKYPVFRGFVLEFSRQAEELSGAPIAQLLLETEANAVEGEIHSDVDQICIFVYQYSMCRWLKELGIEPTAVIGHSLGEITAVLVAGALTFEAALDLVVTRGRLLRPQPGNPGGMAALACPEDTIPDLLEKRHLEEPISISVINGPRSLCVSGASDDIDEFVKIAKEQNVKATRLRVDQGFHSPRVASAAVGLRKWAPSFAKMFKPLRMTLYSTALGGPILRGNPLPRDHWAEHVRNPVLFSKTAASILADKSISTLLDIGPQTVAWSLLLANGCDVGSAVTISGRKEQDQETAFLSALATLYQNHKVTPNFDVLYADTTLATTSIPTYPFQRVHRYPTFIASRNAEGGGHTKPAEVDVEEYANGAEESRAPATKKMTSEELRTALMLCVRDALEILPAEEFDDSESLVSRGIDSITFSGLRKRVEERYGLDLPIVFWSDAFSVKDIIDNLVEQRGSDNI